jgi:hypothetical protein
MMGWDSGDTAIWLITLKLGEKRQYLVRMTIYQGRFEGLGAVFFVIKTIK